MLYIHIDYIYSASLTRYAIFPHSMKFNLKPEDRRAFYDYHLMHLLSIILLTLFCKTEINRRTTLLSFKLNVCTKELYMFSFQWKGSVCNCYIFYCQQCHCSFYLAFWSTWILSWKKKQWRKLNFIEIQYFHQNVLFYNTLHHRQKSWHRQPKKYDTKGHKYRSKYHISKISTIKEMCLKLYCLLSWKVDIY